MSDQSDTAVRYTAFRATVAAPNAAAAHPSDTQNKGRKAEGLKSRKARGLAPSPPPRAPMPQTRASIRHAPAHASATTAASARYMRCSATVCVDTGTKLELGASIRKNHAPKKPAA
ncbi:MAG: hypothetical protein LBI02_01470 [Opitutaceae bacterium]|nr:hypothetical protein [Opitutaceae bacterium]